MTDKLPPQLLILFQPRPPLRFLNPCDVPPEKRRTAKITGVAQYLEELRKPDPDYVPTESEEQKRDRLRQEKKDAHKRRLEEGLASYDPNKDPHIRGDPYKTLFVARLSYDVKETDLEREFGRFGPIERIRIVRDIDTKKPRGYAFIVYERDKDMKAAYKETDGLRIKDRRILVDIERGRTIKGWKPRRLGGGMGGRGYTRVPLPKPSHGHGGFGDRGGFGARGGFRGGGGGFRGSFRGGGGGFRGGDFGGGGGGRFDGPRPPRGGIGYGGDKSGGFGGANGHDAPPNAPTGPGGGRFGRDRGGFGGGGGGGGYSRDDRGYGGGGGRDDRGGRDGGGYNRSYDRDGGYRDRDGGSHRDRDDRGGGRGYDRDRHDEPRKRPFEGDSGYGRDSRRPRY